MNIEGLRAIASLMEKMQHAEENSRMFLLGEVQIITDMAGDDGKPLATLKLNGTTEHEVVWLAAER